MSPDLRADGFPFFPSVFLAGAPRCGTTSIAKLLSRHPEVCFSRPKEVNYFGRVPAEALGQIQRDYLDRYFFHHDPQRHRVVAEGSVSYLYDPEALALINAIQPQARFIVAVRNPIEMLRSYHFRLLYLLEEDEDDFEAAWGLQDARARGERIPRHCADPRRLRYREVARLGTYVERLVELAGRDRCHIVVAEDMWSDPVAACDRLLRFCGVSADLSQFPEIENDNPFPHRFKSRTYRWRWLQRLLYKPPTGVLTAATRSEVRRGVRPAKIKGIHKRLARFNWVKRKPSALRPGFRDQLARELDEEVRKLEVMLGRTLGVWRQGAERQ
jgi:hypothetical protein